MGQSNPSRRAPDRYSAVLVSQGSALHLFPILSMRSHSYDFGPRDLLWLLGPPLIVVSVFAALMHLGAALRVLPKPRPTLDVDRTILIHKAEASKSRSDAQVILIGDSSCLMDVAARQLTELL